MYFTSGSDRAFEQPKPRPEQPDEAAPGLENSVLENPTSDNPTPGNPTLENPMQLNKDISSKEKNDYGCINYRFHSYPFPTLPLGGRSGTAAGTERNGSEITERHRDLS